jgi:hypothetical protein
VRSVVAGGSLGEARFEAQRGIDGAVGALETPVVGLHPQRWQARVEVNVYGGLPSPARRSGVVEDDKL